ncbi:ORF6N domain-containing protein [Desulfobacterium sp. N47]|uniref:KilA-N DNA-binding domain-containing protein n=1 Tax=uncultured Desulfobacterium sp. TaxID=201089 RepID=E1YM90_9BACT|nr:hypothetical protein N47_E47350 [uncultured Desulfobacterium sp.]
MAEQLSAEIIATKIHLIRGEKVILDKDLAELYGVSTSILNKAVSRNIDRFPSDFMFALTKDEFSNLKFHFGISSWGGTRKLPRAFTEQGVAMLSGVLKSKRAVVVNIEIMRAFVQLRNLVSSHKQLAGKLSELEQKLEGHDEQIQIIFQAIKELMTTTEKPKRKIGFTIKEKQRAYSKGNQ